MAILRFFSQSARDADNLAGNSARLVNCYLEPIVAGGRAAFAVKSVLAQVPFSQIPGTFTRAMGVINSKLFAVAGGTLNEIAADGGYTSRGAIDSDANTTIAGNNGSVTVVANAKYYHWDGTTLTNPAAGAFSSFGSHDYIGNYTVLTEKSARRFQWSAVANGASLPGTSFSTADGRDDNIVRAFTINGALYLFKETSHEIWYLTGLAGAAAFERQAGGVYDVGLKAHNLITRFPGSAFYVGADGRAYIVAQGVQPVSIPPVETAIKSNSPQACFTYEDEGHTFCVITFSTGPAWVYDVALGEWHERSEGAAYGPWAASCSAKFGAKWYVGNLSADLCSLETAQMDNGADFICEATSRTYYQGGDRFSVPGLEIYPRRGFSAGNLTLRLSRDGGITWGAGKDRSYGPIGDFNDRVIWRALGQFRQITAVIRATNVAGFVMLADGRLG